MIRTSMLTAALFAFSAGVLLCGADSANAQSPFQVRTKARKFDDAVVFGQPDARVVKGSLLKVHVYFDGTWPGKGGGWVVGATVTITNGRVQQTLVTDQYGDASFYPLPGTYTINVKKSGVGEGTQVATLPAQGLLVSFPISRSAAAANFPHDKIFIPKHKFPFPPNPVR